MPIHSDRCEDFDALVKTIAALRDPDHGCPWDKKQTHASIANNFIEETYEVVDAIEANDVPHMCEELGDVLMQVVLQAQIAEDNSEFTIDDVCRGINEKLIRRHPHVFGDAAADTPEEVNKLWSRIKMEERATSDAQAQAPGEKREGLLDGVPTSFPALLQAQKISRKAVAVGFEWESVDDVWAKVAEEIEEFKTAETPEDAQLEFGDVLFALVNVARWSGFDAEEALRQSNNKFRRRWSFMEGAAWAQGRDIAELTGEELEDLWQQAKRHERE
ncbi:MazG family protein [Slackia heliotrinireducens DSM 20476]|uniref:MazG family protein n=2 Tax=Slackia TaxID=84108 RepID=C7N0Q7_SLAHD|nr:MazG family protein [Slackia heliotrinireducens DSM 20476]